MSGGGRGGFGGKGKIAFGKINLVSTVAGVGEEDERKDDDGGSGGFGVFGSGTAFKPPPRPEEKSEEELQMERTMGFSGFGTVRNLPQKVAKTFDVKEMVEAIKKANKGKAPSTTTDNVIKPLEIEEEVVKPKKKQVRLA